MMSAQNWCDLRSVSYRPAISRYV